MHPYGEEFLSKTLTVIVFYYNFYCLFVLKSDKCKLLDLHRLKLIHLNFLVVSNFKKVFKWALIQTGISGNIFRTFFVIFVSRPRLSGDLSLKCHKIYFLPLAPELRLSDSPVPHAGRVELRIKGIWGTIFQRHSYYTLRPGATRVICRQLGFSDAVISADYSLYGPGVGPEWLDSSDLDGCLGHEKNILNCSYSSPRFSTYYGHSNDVSVVCKPNTSHTSGK